MANIGYSTLTVIPSLREVQQQLTSQVVRPSTAAGKAAGGRLRSGMPGSLKGMAGRLR